MILVDDGLASGFTMMAAVESVPRRRPRYIIVAVPAASEAALSQLMKYADKVVALATSNAKEFYLADFYEVWHDLTEDEAPPLPRRVPRQENEPGHREHQDTESAEPIAE